MTRKTNAKALRDPKVSVVIPVYNEKDTILEILARVLATDMRKEIVIVDDASRDGTRELLQSLRELQAKGDSSYVRDDSEAIELRDLRFFFQSPNQGKGAAMRRGFAEATGDIVLVQDADLEYDPLDYPKLLEPILDGRATSSTDRGFLAVPNESIIFGTMSPIKP